MSYADNPLVVSARAAVVAEYPDMPYADALAASRRDIEARFWQYTPTHAMGYYAGYIKALADAGLQGEAVNAIMRTRIRDSVILSAGSAFTVQYLLEAVERQRNLAAPK